VAAACGASGGRTSGAPTLDVATDLWPLATAAAAIGQGNVKVTDVVPAGQDPATYRLDRAETGTVAHAGLSVRMGGWNEPGYAAAAARARHEVTLPADGPSPYVWLSPHAMEAAGRRIAAALEAAEPAAAKTFRNGLASFEAELSSLDSDYQSTLSSCPDQTIVTVNDAFAVLHPYYPVVDRAIAPAGVSGLPSAATIDREVAAIKKTGAKKIYIETWIPESYIIGATTRTGVQVGTLDTLAGPVSSPWPVSVNGKKYFSLMEENLGTISSALHCPNPNAT